jgi:RNA polymerase sigma factor (sigma-70 family)
MYFSSRHSTSLQNQSTSEKDLLKLAANGDANSIAWLYKENGPKLFSICKRYACDDETAADYFQDGFLHILNKLSTFKGNSSISTWMHTVMTNHCINELRKPANKMQWHTSENIEELAVEDEVMEEEPNVSTDELLKLIQKLPHGYRLVINLYAIENKSHTEISQLLGINEVTSRSQLFKARRMLKLQIKELGYEL